MKQLVINSDQVGEEFLEALSEVIETRIDRRNQYGDSYLEDDDIFLRLQIENKVKRLKLNFEEEEVPQFNDQKIETIKDSLRDNICYSLFLIAKIQIKQKWKTKNLF